MSSEKNKNNLSEQIKELPEIYQPVFGHPRLSGKPSRPCTDRLQEIVRVYDALQTMLGRPLKVLDLGCAQGFFSFSLAERGAIVHGVDYLDKNIAVCEAIAEEHPDFKVSFETGRIEPVIERLEKDQYDLVLGLSVFHHVIHEKGVEVVKALLERAAACAGVLVIESALKEEPLYWAPAQPEDPRSLFKKIAFVHELARHGTHLAPVPRPLYAASNRYWVLGNYAGAFETWTEDPHAFAIGNYQGSRRYFFNASHVVKFYRFDHPLGAGNREEFVREVRFLGNVPEGFTAANCLVSGSNDTEGWVVLERKPGNLLLGLLREGADLNRIEILRSVLRQLAVLEKSGLYHNDVRTWNILVDKDGSALLIDYGSISAEENDCVWPENRFLSFLIFVHELSTGVIDPPNPMRNVAITPYTLPQPYRAWGIALWKRPLRDWSYKMMHDTLVSLPKQPKDGEPEQPADAWAGAIENALDAQRQYMRTLNGRVVDGEGWPKDLVSILERMEASVAESQAGAAARVADSEARRQEAEARSLEAEVRSQESESRAQRAEVRCQESEIRAQKAERELHERMTDLVGVQARVSEVQQELAQVKAEHEVLRAANHMQQVQVEEKEARIEDLTTELNTLRKDHERLLEANHIHWTLAHERQTQIEDLTAELKKLKEDHCALLGANHANWMTANERQAQIEEMMKSLSWRCAAPIRWAGVQWRRLRGEGPTSRLKALIKKVLRCPLRRAVKFIDRHPAWRYRVINASRRLGVHSVLKKIYWRGRVGPDDCGDGNCFLSSAFGLFTGELLCLTGVSRREAWGCWSNSDLVELEFSEPLPDRFTLHLTAKAFGPNIGREFIARIGKTEVQFTLDGFPDSKALEFINTERNRDLIIHVPEPTAPASISASQDDRKLGIGLCGILIEADGKILPVDFLNCERNGQQNQHHFFGRNQLTPQGWGIYADLKRAIEKGRMPDADCH